MAPTAGAFAAAGAVQFAGPTGDRKQLSPRGRIAIRGRESKRRENADAGSSIASTTSTRRMSDAGRRAGLDCFGVGRTVSLRFRLGHKAGVAPAARIRCLPAIRTEARGCCGTCSIRPAFETDLPRGDAALVVRAGHTGWGGFVSRSRSTSSSPAATNTSGLAVLPKSVITPRVQVVHCHRTLDRKGKLGWRNRDRRSEAGAGVHSPRARATSTSRHHRRRSSAGESRSGCRTPMPDRPSRQRPPVALRTRGLRAHNDAAHRQEDGRQAPCAARSGPTRAARAAPPQPGQASHDAAATEHPRGRPNSSQGRRSQPPDRPGTAHGKRPCQRPLAVGSIWSPGAGRVSLVIGHFRRPGSASRRRSSRRQTDTNRIASARRRRSRSRLARTASRARSPGGSTGRPGKELIAADRGEADGCVGLDMGSSFALPHRPIAGPGGLTTRGGSASALPGQTWSGRPGRVQTEAPNYPSPDASSIGAGARAPASSSKVAMAAPRSAKA